MSKLMRQINPFFLFPISHFASPQEIDEEQHIPEWDPSCGFILELQKTNLFPEKIGAFIHWTEFSDDEIFDDFSSEESDFEI